jgi:hypothetical protein
MGGISQFSKWLSSSHHVLSAQPTLKQLKIRRPEGYLKILHPILPFIMAMVVKYNNE